MKYDIAVIGAGPAGYVGAIRAAQLGAKAVVIEKGELGGVCMNVGCIPTKTIIASTDLFSKIKRASAYGIEILGEAKANYSRIMERAQKVVEIGREGIQSLLDSNKIELIKGEASLIGDEKIQIKAGEQSEKIVECENILIATGSSPMGLKGVPFDGTHILCSDDLFIMEEIPETMTIIGGGVEGCEWAFIFASLGCKVTVIEMLERALPLEDAEISKTLQREMKKKRITFKAGAKVKAIEKGPDGKSAVVIEDGSKVESEKVLVAIGRVFNTGDLGLDKAGIELDDLGAIKVNNRMETSAKGLYAAGDVIGGMMLAHVASAEAIVAVENALGKKASIDYESIPAGIFTSPEIGRVGLTEEEAVKKGMKLKIGRFNLRVLMKAHALGEIDGFVKIISDSKDGRVVGAHIMGAHAADIIHELALAVRHRMKVDQVASLIHAHPTLSEAVMEAALDVSEKAIHK
jgi:dihydrolipoamide dehydrogenase